MGIFDWFKKSKQERKQIKFEELETWIKNKRQQDKEKLLIQEIKSNLEELNKRLKENLNELGDLDLTKKKAEPKIKLIIEENFNNYLNYLKKLITEIEELNQQISQEPQTLDNLIKKINILFFNFEKKSESSFQKATYLIGEIGKAKDNLNNFFNFLKNILKENKDLIETSKAINFISNKLKEHKYAEKTRKQIKNSIEEIEDKLQDLDAKNKNIYKIVVKIKEGDECKGELKKQQDIESQKKELKNSFWLLKQLIDFKELANIFHANEKEMKIIKEHKENFQEAFGKDGGSRLIELISFLQKTNMNKQMIIKKAEEILRRQSEIKIVEDNLELKALTDILIKNSEIKEINMQMESLMAQKIKENKRLEKIQINQDEIKEVVREELLKMGVDLITSK